MIFTVTSEQKIDKFIVKYKNEENFKTDLAKITECEKLEIINPEKIRKQKLCEVIEEFYHCSIIFIINWNKLFE